jgi:hypothetical protein
MSEVFDYENVKWRKPTLSTQMRRVYQKVFRENVEGSHIDNCHTCALPPSSVRTGVAGRNGV